MLLLSLSGRVPCVAERPSIPHICVRNARSHGVQGVKVPFTSFHVSRVTSRVQTYPRLCAERDHYGAAVLAHIEAHPSASATTMADAVLVMFSEGATWLTSFDACLLRAQELHALSQQELQRAAHCLWCRVHLKVRKRSEANVRPVGEGVPLMRALLLAVCCLFHTHA